MVNHDTIKGFIESRINDKVEVSLLSEYTNYFGTTKSFKMVCNSRHNLVILDPSLWPNGTVIRRFFEKKKVNQATNKGETNENQQATQDVNKHGRGRTNSVDKGEQELNMEESVGSFEGARQTQVIYLW